MEKEREMGKAILDCPFFLSFWSSPLEMKEAASESEMEEDALSGRYWARGGVRERRRGGNGKKSQALTRRIQIENEIESTPGDKNWKDRN